MSRPIETTLTQVTTAQGSRVVVHTQGEGPGVVILHGAGVTAKDYRRLAERWAPRLTVHRYSRRGCPESAPISGAETAATDLEDLAAVLDSTGARQVFGHSGGAFVATRASLSTPLDRIAVYDPAVALTGVDFPRDFLDPFEKAVARGDVPLALALMGADINRDTAAAKMPLSLQKLIVRGFLHTPPGKQMRDLLPTIVPEIRRILAAEGPASEYGSVGADVLLAYGERSSRYFGDICRSLDSALPSSQVLAMGKFSHNAANIARPAFAAPFADFLAG